MLRRGIDYPNSSDSEDAYVQYESPRSAAVANRQPMPLLMIPPGSTDVGSSLGITGNNYMVLQNTSMNDKRTTSSIVADGGRRTLPYDVTNTEDKGESTFFTSLLSSINEPEGLLQQMSVYFFQCLSSPTRLLFFGLALLLVLFAYPLISMIAFGCLFLLLFGGQKSDDNQNTSRTVKWTVTCFSLQMKDGFLTSPAFIDKSGQWRLIIKQKKGMEGPQTSFGLMCTDIFPDVETVSAAVTFYCTNQIGQEINTGGLRNLTFQEDFQGAGDCGMTRPIRISRRMLGDHEVVLITCTVEFRKKSVTFLKHLARNFGTVGNLEEQKHLAKKGKNVVTEHGNVYSGDLQFNDDASFALTFRPLLRFLQHFDTKTFIWEIPAFTSLLENSEMWGLYSPQFFLNSQDICAMWRLKLMEIQGVFRLHVQLRGLPQQQTAKQVKLWYLLQMVDRYGQSVIPEHAVARLKYPDHMNLWDTTRHILYRRETILEKFVQENGALCLRISLQMQPNDVSLMAVDSDDWIHSSHVENALEYSSRQLGGEQHPMITNN